MKILINALSVHSGGALTSFLNLIPELGCVDEHNEYSILLSRSQEVLEKVIPPRFGRLYVKFDPRNVLLRGLYEQVVLPILLAKHDIDWLYSLGNQTTLFAPCNIFLVVENANPYSKLDLDWPARERLRNSVLRLLGKWSIKRATKVRFLSENSRQHISRMFAIPQEKTVVIHHGVNLEAFKKRREHTLASLPEHYILTVSNIMPNKNIHTLIDAFELLVQRYNYPGSLLVVGAELFSHYKQALLEKKKRFRTSQKIIFLGWVGQSALVPLYQHADLFVFPSVVETFGIPVIEAMAAGIPVIASSNTVQSPDLFIPFEELLGDAARYCSPFDSVMLCEEMQKVLSDRDIQSKIITAGLVRAQQFTWNMTARALADIFSSRA